MKRLLPNDVNAFIRGQLQDRLTKDFIGRPFRIFRERDLHTCSYFHLRRFLRADKRWEIVNEPFLRNLKGSGKSAQPDIVLFRKGKPVFIIELKFRRKNTSVRRKDKRVFRKALRGKTWAKKAFYIQTVIEQGGKKQQNVVKNRSMTFIIPMRTDRKKEYLFLYDKRRKPEPRTVRHLTSRSS